MENLYAVLGCKEDACYEEIKNCYQKLALAYHPDKSQPQAGTSSVDMFIQINSAWKILRDPNLRKQFDIRWNERCLAQTWPIHEDVDIKEFDSCVENKETVFTYPCRCGGSYLLSQTDVNIKFDIVCCDSCSLSIRIMYSSETENSC